MLQNDVQLFCCPQRFEDGEIKGETRLEAGCDGFGWYVGIVDCI